MPDMKTIPDSKSNSSAFSGPSVQSSQSGIEAPVGAFSTAAPVSDAKPAQGLGTPRSLDYANLYAEDPHAPGVAPGSVYRKRADLFMKPGRTTPKDGRIPAEAIRYDVKDTFEQYLGHFVYKNEKANDAAHTMAKKSYHYMQERTMVFAKTEQMNDELNNLLIECGVPATMGYAGGIGKGKEALGSLRRIFSGQGTLRETATHLGTFAAYVLLRDMIVSSGNAEDEAKLDRVYKQVHFNIKEAHARQNEAKRIREKNKATRGYDLFGDAKEAREHFLDSMKPEDKERLAKSGPEKSEEEIAKRMKDAQDNDIDKLNIAGLAKDPYIAQGDMRVRPEAKRKDNEKRTEAPKEKPAGHGNKKDEAWSTTKKSDFIAQGGELSEYEQGQKNTGIYNKTLAGLIEKGVPELEAKAQAEAIAKEYLPWTEGMRGWHMDQTSQLVQLCNEAEIPLMAGVSGHTVRLMNTGHLLGCDPLGTRLVCLGYLLPIKAHSFHEIMESAVPYGCDYDPGDYLELKPFSKALILDMLIKASQAHNPSPEEGPAPDPSAG